MPNAGKKVRPCQPIPEPLIYFSAVTRTFSLCRPTKPEESFRGAAVRRAGYSDNSSSSALTSPCPLLSSRSPSFEVSTPRATTSGAWASDKQERPQARCRKNISRLHKERPCGCDVSNWKGTTDRATPLRSAVRRAEPFAIKSGQAPFLFAHFSSAWQQTPRLWGRSRDVEAHRDFSCVNRHRTVDQSASKSGHWFDGFWHRAEERGACRARSPNPWRAAAH